MNIIKKGIDIYRKNLYINLPLYKITRSKAFWEHYKFLKATETWTSDKIQLIMLMNMFLFIKSYTKNMVIDQVTLEA